MYELSIAMILIAGGLFGVLWHVGLFGKLVSLVVSLNGMAVLISRFDLLRGETTGSLIGVFGLGLCFLLIMTTVAVMFAKGNKARSCERKGN